MLTRVRAVGSEKRSRRACDREKEDRMLVAANVILGASARGICTSYRATVDFFALSNRCCSLSLTPQGEHGRPQ